ncbi:hypothetical protein JRO89_XS13G0089700 [Xanthoceras sorbifolium]|uniref:Protein DETOXIFICATION n=1 Tax=Xanthoceras sorbifolium TaxID=99658 RepID=A0ABQ8H7E0_9ROSI|nr:hypothetical protein JRO89_XS13G0089700 [Xanthoceras sorbifolium]
MDQEDTKSTLDSPLIPSSEKGFGYGDHTLAKNNNAEIIVELKKQMRLAGPLVVVSFLQYSLQMISVMFVGRLDELSLASASMATSFAGVTGFSFMLGMASALETLCGQAFGAKQYHMLGIHMQRAMLVLTLVSIPIAVLWGFTEEIFTMLKQDPEISMHAGLYAWWLIPSILPYGLLQCQLRFLQAQNNVLPLIISTGISSLVHVLACWTSIFRFGFGNKGFSKEALDDLLSFIELGIPSALMVCLEQWSYEFLIIVSGLLSNPKLETSMMSISMNTSAVAFRIPFGLGSAISTRVSNELGAGRPYAARLAVLIVMFLAVTQGLLLSSIAVAVRSIWGYMYTNDEELVRYLASVMPVLAISNFLDGMQTVLSGTTRGCGWQKIGAYVNLGSYYLVGLPFAIILTFVFHFGGKGLWMGIMCGSGLQALLLCAITMHTNWEQEAMKSKARVFASTIPTNLAS